MASDASSSSAGASTSMVEVRPQAGPLPQKVGEIGFQSPEGETNANTLSEVDLSDAAATLPTLTRNQPGLARSASSSPTPSSNTSTGPTNPGTASSESLPHSTTSANSTSKKSILSFFRSKRPIPKLGLGISAPTILRFFFLLATISGTIAGWIVTVQRLERQPATDLILTGSANPDATGVSSMIFVHVAFGIGLLFQLLFFERTIFQARAERFLYLNPDAANGTGRAVMGIAPWNRPPLPTYAAALGVRGTGDVEDAIIAAPPPPAYGNTRGSTLLLAGALRDSMRSAARLSQASLGSIRQSHHTGRSSRPISYDRSNGVEEERRDAARARAVEEALARLEEGDATRR